jgi:hypothetical protein
LKIKQLRFGAFFKFPFFGFFSFYWILLEDIIMQFKPSLALLQLNAQPPLPQ